jgi:lysophospholipid acyltransferase 1/2
MIIDYGGYTLDFTGPLMVLVQKFSLSAFSLHDGVERKDSELNEDERKNKIRGVPPVLAYYGYCFNFLQFLTGPSCTYTEYVKFIDGTNFHVDNPNKYGKAKIHANGPSTIFPCLTSLVAALLAMTVYLSLSGVFTLESYVDPEQNRSFLQRLVYGLSVAFVLRCRYYMAWKFIEASSNAAGLGYSGCDKMGNPEWELSKNCKPLSYEFATNIRAAISSWNITTNTWLRRICYDRVSFHPTLMTFVLSAFWHGFYPGYYFCFVSFAVLVATARKGRNTVRPYFIGNSALKLMYDITTTLLTATFLNTCGLSFQYLHFNDAVKNFTNLYCLQIIIPVMFLLLPLNSKRRTKSKFAANETSNQQATAALLQKEEEDLHNIDNSSDQESRVPELKFKTE